MICDPEHVFVLYDLCWVTTESYKTELVHSCIIPAEGLSLCVQHTCKQTQLLLNTERGKPGGRISNYHPSLNRCDFIYIENTSA